jgi:hypothetical protein
MSLEDNILNKICYIWVNIFYSIDAYIILLSLAIITYIKSINYKQYASDDNDDHHSWYMLYIIYGITHVYNINYLTESPTQSPLFSNYLLNIHPPLLLLSIFYMMDLLTTYQNNIYIKSEWVLLYLTLASAIILGGVWASTTFGWGGFWFWDPIENIIYCTLIILILILHSQNNNKFFLKYVFLLIILNTCYVMYIEMNLFESLHSFNLINDNANSIDSSIFIYYLNICIIVYIIYILIYPWYPKEHYILILLLYLIPMLIYFNNKILLPTNFFYIPSQLNSILLYPVLFLLTIYMKHALSMYNLNNIYIDNNILYFYITTLYILIGQFVFNMHMHILHIIFFNILIYFMFIDKYDSYWAISHTYPIYIIYYVALYYNNAISSTIRTTTNAFMQLEHNSLTYIFQYMHANLPTLEIFMHNWCVFIQYEYIDIIIEYASSKYSQWAPTYINLIKSNTNFSNIIITEMSQTTISFEYYIMMFIPSLITMIAYMVASHMLETYYIHDDLYTRNHY